MASQHQRKPFGRSTTEVKRWVQFLFSRCKLAIELKFWLHSLKHSVPTYGISVLFALYVCLINWKKWTSHNECCTFWLSVPRLGFASSFFLSLFCRFALFLICCCFSYGCDYYFYCFLLLYWETFSVYFYNRTPFISWGPEGCSPLKTKADTGKQLAK